MGRTEFLTPTIRSEPRLESANHNESEMALFNECTQLCAQKVLDAADIVRDGDLWPVWPQNGHSLLGFFGVGEFLPPASITTTQNAHTSQPHSGAEGKAPAATPAAQVSNANPSEFDPLENLRRRRERAFLLELRRASLLIVASERDCKEVTSATLVTGTRVASQTSRGFVGSGEGCQWLRCSQVPRPSLRSTDRRVGGAGL